MAFSREDIQVAGARALRDRLRAIRDMPRTISRDPRISEEIIKRTKDRFRTKKDPDGRRWKAIKKSFGRPPLYGRKSNTDRSDILVDRGDLRDSIGLTGRRGSTTGLGFRIGITDQRQIGKGALHQGGGTSPLTGGRVPARPFLGISRQDTTIVERLLLRIAKEQGL